MFFESWGALGRIVVVGVLAYVALVAMLRISGNRSLSKMNAFDLVVTVALGSTLATVLLSTSTTLVEGVVALGLLLTLQFLVTWVSVRSSTLRRLVVAEPVLLLYRGTFLENAMRRQRVLEAEVRAAVRGQGIASLEEVEAVVLETDGSFSVVSASDTPPTALQSLSLPPGEGT